MSLNGISNPVETTTSVINPNAFFPDIELQVFIDIYRLPSEYKESTLVHVLKNAMSQVNDKIYDFVLILQSAIVAETLDAFNAGLVDVYKAAVMNWARDGLFKFYETANRQKAADIQAERAEAIKTPWIDEANTFIDAITKAMLATAKEYEVVAEGRFASGFKAVAI